MYIVVVVGQLNEGITALAGDAARRDGIGNSARPPYVGDGLLSRYPQAVVDSGEKGKNISWLCAEIASRARAATLAGANSDEVIHNPQGLSTESGELSTGLVERGGLDTRDGPHIWGRTGMREQGGESNNAPLDCGEGEKRG